MKIAVLFGGTSAERDVSVASASQVVEALRRNGHEVLAVETTRGVLPAAEERELLRQGIDRAPPAGHEGGVGTLPVVVASGGLVQDDVADPVAESAQIPHVFP